MVPWIIGFDGARISIANTFKRISKKGQSKKRSGKIANFNLGILMTWKLRSLEILCDNQLSNGFNSVGCFSVSHTHKAPRVRLLSVRLGALEGLFQYLRLASRNTRHNLKGDTVLKLNKPRRG